MLHALAVITLSATLSPFTTSRIANRGSQDLSSSMPLTNAGGSNGNEQPSPGFFAPQEPNSNSQQPESQTPVTSPAASQGESSSKQNLPDKPVPKDITPREGCPDIDGAPCANFGGFRFFNNTTFTEHNRTWGQAMSHPIMWITATALFASTVFDIEGTQHCLALKACTEANPIFGKHPSRARAYGTAIPLFAVGLYSMGRLKQSGHGFGAFFVAFTGIALHSWFGMPGWAATASGSTK